MPELVNSGFLRTPFMAKPVLAGLKPKRNAPIALLEASTCRACAVRCKDKPQFKATLGEA